MIAAYGWLWISAAACSRYICSWDLLKRWYHQTGRIQAGGWGDASPPASISIAGRLTFPHIEKARMQKCRRKPVTVRYEKVFTFRGGGGEWFAPTFNRGSALGPHWELRPQTDPRHLPTDNFWICPWPQTLVSRLTCYLFFIQVMTTLELVVCSE